MNKFDVCIIGCGDIGFLFDYKKKTNGALSHFKAFRESGKYNVTAAAELKSETRSIISEKYNIGVYKDYELMLNQKKPDVIVIATNDESHFQILKDVIKHKPKIVFTEKPLALNYKDVKEIISSYKKNKIHLQVNYTRRFMKEFQQAENDIRSGKIGEPETATLYYSRGLMHNASHYIDLINWFIGETEKNLIRISDKEGLGKSDPSVSFMMRYKNGLEIRFIGLKPSKLTFAEIDIIGSKGRIRINSSNEMEKYRVIPNKLFKGYTSFEKYESKSLQFSKALPAAAENIYNVLTGKEKLLSPAENSLKIFELISRIKEKPICLN